MSQAYQIKDQSAAHYVTLQIVQWADIFTRKIYRDIVIESLKYCQKEKGLEIYAYVIMSNHIHSLIRSAQENLKEIFSNKFIEQKLDYLPVRQAGIHNNPVVSGIVANPEDYIYSSAGNYADLESILDIIEVSRTWKAY